MNAEILDVMRGKSRKTRDLLATGLADDRLLFYGLLQCNTICCESLAAQGSLAGIFIGAMLLQKPRAGNGVLARSTFRGNVTTFSASHAFDNPTWGYEGLHIGSRLPGPAENDIY